MYCRASRGPVRITFSTSPPDPSRPRGDKYMPTTVRPSFGSATLDFSTSAFTAATASATVTCFLPLISSSPSVDAFAQLWPASRSDPDASERRVPEQPLAQRRSLRVLGGLPVQEAVNRALGAAAVPDRSTHVWCLDGVLGGHEEILHRFKPSRASCLDGWEPGGVGGTRSAGRRLSRRRSRS